MTGVMQFRFGEHGLASDGAFPGLHALTLTVIFRNLKKCPKRKPLHISHLQKLISVIYGFLLLLSIWFLFPSIRVDSRAHLPSALNFVCTRFSRRLAPFADLAPPTYSELLRATPTKKCENPVPPISDYECL